MAKFKVGDICEVVYTRSKNNPNWYPGQEVEVVEVCLGSRSPRSRTPCDYKVTFCGRYAGYVLEVQLRKHPPTPTAGDWGEIEELTQWNPSKEKVNG